MSEAFIIGLIWGVVGTLLLQVATALIYRLGSRRNRAAALADHGADRRAPAREIEQEVQVAQIDRMQERLAVLERLATDPAQRTAREIELLR